jgi:uncharacterized protein YdhG (YjbR/CyaY superfamily)
MAIDKSDRTSYFPIIEKRYGEPMSYWHRVMGEIGDWKYPEQIAYLKENFGFSQSHANALVMYSRGSLSSKKYQTVDQYLKEYTPLQKKAVKAILKVFTDKYPKSEVVIAWNKPMIKYKEDYVFTVTVAKNHLMLAPWGDGVLDQFRPKLEDYVVAKKTFRVPLDWEIDKKLLLGMAKARIDQLK